MEDEKEPNFMREDNIFISPEDEFTEAFLAAKEKYFDKMTPQLTEFLSCESLGRLASFVSMDDFRMDMVHMVSLQHKVIKKFVKEFEIASKRYLVRLEHQRITLIMTLGEE